MMRYHIDTIPVWDSLKLDGECLFCALHRKLELSEAERYLGASVMEPDTRIQVNERGFCRDHHAMLFGMSNRLGHALMLESHNARTRERLAKPLDRMAKAASAFSSAGLLKRGGQTKKDLLDAANEIAAMASTCILCDSLQENMDRYLHTFFHLYHNDTDFRTRFNACKGVCLPHLAELARIAPDELPANEVGPFIGKLTDLTRTNMERMQEDISWFIKKFDYRFVNEPWKNSQDAVPRSVNKLRGWCVGNEPNPKEK